MNENLPHIPISIGELFDKLSILEIKLEKIKDEEKQKNVRKEFELLQTYAASLLDKMDDKLKTELENEFRKLKSVNEKLWTIEDQIRDKERAKSFDDEFIHLARSVYRTNDDRAQFKKQMNLLLNSPLIEEKSYQSY